MLVKYYCSYYPHEGLMGQDFFKMILKLWKISPCGTDPASCFPQTAGVPNPVETMPNELPGGTQKLFIPASPNLLMDICQRGSGRVAGKA